jgi:NAD+ synthetase
MVEFYRTEPLDYEKVFENIVKGTSEYLAKCNLKAMVLGISGGIDSTVCAAICKEVSKITKIPFFGVSLPCSTNGTDEVSSATLTGNEFCTTFEEINLEGVYETVEDFCRGTLHNIDATPISRGNIKARLRMITLYDIASRMSGLVIDTDNLTENYLGFYTLHGDCCDFNPIGGLWKHEVYGLAKWLKDNVYKDSKALEAAIAIIPTDGNGVKAGGDLEQIAPGKTYDDVDEILYAWVGLDSCIKDIVIKNYFDYGVFKKLCEKHGYETVEAVIMRSVRSEFKRKHLPLVVNIYNGIITDKDGR